MQDSNSNSMDSSFDSMDSMNNKAYSRALETKSSKEKLSSMQPSSQSYNKNRNYNYHPHFRQQISEIK